MSHDLHQDPYSPPRAAVVAAKALPKRPVLLTALLGLLSLVLLLTTTGFFFGIKSILQTWMRPSVHLIAPWALFGAILLRVVGLGLLVFTGWAILRRRSYGRWLGALFLALLAFLMVYKAMMPAEPQIFPRLEYTGDSGRGPIYEGIWTFFFFVGLLTWANAVISGENSRRYFGVLPAASSAPSAPPARDIPPES